MSEDAIRSTVALLKKTIFWCF